MKATFRIPGFAEYSYIEIETSEGSPFDVTREVRDMDDNFLTQLSTTLESARALAALGVLKPTVVHDAETDAARESWESAQPAPAWAQEQPQEAQAALPVSYQGSYVTQPPGSYVPQPYQGYPQQGQQLPTSVQAQDGRYAQPQAAQNPPGVQGPVCQRHGQAAKLKPGGISQRTGKPYNAFWTCASGDNECTKASNFPRA